MLRDLVRPLRTVLSILGLQKKIKLFNISNSSLNLSQEKLRRLIRIFFLYSTLFEGEYKRVRDNFFVKKMNSVKIMGAKEK